LGTRDRSTPVILFNIFSAENQVLRRGEVIPLKGYFDVFLKKIKEIGI